MSDWRERRDALVAEYLERAGGNPRAAYDAINVALDSLAPPIEEKLILDHLNARAALFRMRLDPTGVLLTPSYLGKDCLGNGQHEGYECCCDECDYYLTCFPKHTLFGDKRDFWKPTVREETCEECRYLIKSNKPRQLCAITKRMGRDLRGTRCPHFDKIKE